MCNILDGKSYELLQLLVQYQKALEREARRLGVSLDASEINRVIKEARALVYAPAKPSDDSYRYKESDDNLTEPFTGMYNKGGRVLSSEP